MQRWTIGWRQQFSRILRLGRPIQGVTALFDGNTGVGIAIWGSSSLQVWDDGVAVNITSTNNTGRGLEIWGGSDVGFNSPASSPPSRVVISNNGAEGIEVGGNGTLYSRIPSQIKDNAFEGVGMWAGGHVGIEGATIADNTGRGNCCPYECGGLVNRKHHRKQWF